MNIIFISPSFYPATYYGGPIYSTYELAKALKKTGVDVRVITTNANGNEKLRSKNWCISQIRKRSACKIL